MATSKKKQDFDFEGVIMAAASGVATGPLINLLQDQVFPNNKQVVPGVVLGGALALAYFGGERLKPAAMGMIAVSSGDLASEMFGIGTGAKSDIIDGFSRVNYMGDLMLSGEDGEPSDSLVLSGTESELDEMVEEYSDDNTDLGY